jgi:hypothetical protein
MLEARKKLGALDLKVDREHFVVANVDLARAWTEDITGFLLGF